MAPDESTITDHRLDALERSVRQLRDDAISQRWLEERFGRLDDRIADLRDDIASITTVEKQRRLAVYAALVTGVVSLVSALVIVAVTTQGGAV